MATKFQIPTSWASLAYEAELLQPQVANLRVLTVGKDGGTNKQKPATYFQNRGFKTDFRTIGEAMDAIPLVKTIGVNPKWSAAERKLREHNFTDRWVILVTPGYYEEEIYMKPYVSVVGLGHHSVFVQAPAERPFKFTRATVYLNHFSSIRNIVIGKRADSLPNDFAIWNKDLYGVTRYGDDVKIDPSDFGAWDVPIFPFIDPSRGLGPRGEFNEGKSILMEGRFATAFMVEVGASYNGTAGYDFEIRGQGQNADCHIVDCFFDALFLPEGDLMKNEGGCLRVDNCIEVHLRNSLLRVGTDIGAEWTVPKPAPDAPSVPSTHGSAVRVVRNGHVLVEGSTLLAPGARSDQVLHVDEGALAGMFHSSTDSVRGGRYVYERGPLPRNPDGSIRDGQT